MKQMEFDVVLEGTGTEIAEFAQEHRHERFRLVALGDPKEPAKQGPGSPGWEHMMTVIHSFKGKLRTLPPEATSTEALYD